MNEYYTNHYLSTIFEENASQIIKNWWDKAKEKDLRTPWSLLRESAKQYYVIHEKSLRARSGQMFPLIRDIADSYLSALGYEKTQPFTIPVDGEENKGYIYTEVKKQNGAPLLWVMLSHKGSDEETALLHEYSFDSDTLENQNPSISSLNNEDLATKILYSLEEAPRWLIIIGKDAIVLIDRNKWNEKRYLEFDIKDIFRYREESTLQIMSILLHKDSLCPNEGSPVLDTLDENSNRHARGVSQDLKYALRESIELLGNEVIYDKANRQGIDLEENPINAGELSIQCLRYMYRMLFMFFIEARPELGYAPMDSTAYTKGYSLESLRDITDSIREETSEVGEGYYLYETLEKLFDLIYNGYPQSEDELKKLSTSESYHHVFIIDPLKAHIFDPEYTPLLSSAKLRNQTLLKIIDLMSISRPTGRRKDRRGRISYAALGINQMGAVYESLLSYRGFIAEETLFEVKRARDEINELDVGYFVTENELDNYAEEERARYSDGRLRIYEKDTFIYRLAGREREKSASYYTPEVLTQCLVKYSLKELLEGKTADEIIDLTICEPAMGSAAFLNEAINQLAEAYLEKKQKELGEYISHQNRFSELQKVKMFIADRNVYGIDLNPIAVELAEVSLWLNTIYKDGFVPWFGTQLVCGNSLIGARKQCYHIEKLQTSSKGIRWYDSAPKRVPIGSKRKIRKEVYHFLTGDPGMANYKDKVIKGLAPDEIKAINKWNKKFIQPYNDDEIQNLLRLSSIIDKLWEKQIELRKEVGEKTSDALTIYGQNREETSSYTTIREKDMIYKRLYKSEEQKNAGPYARLKFAMDYWCSLWFWPIDKADLLPTRSEFISDMYLILEGTIETLKGVNKEVKAGQLSFLPTEFEQLAIDINKLYSGMGVVDIPKLCQQQPRLALARGIANKQKFMHWELEFADLFSERGGFDLIIGNPPWIKIEWNEQAILSDSNPMFVVQDLTATQTIQHRAKALEDLYTKKLYFNEYESMIGTQDFLGAITNYAVLKGIKTNLFKCFIPQGMKYANNKGIFSFLHPEGVYNETQGGDFRRVLYTKLRAHYQFQNQQMYFEIGHRERYSINIYCNKPTKSFDTIANIIDVSTIASCFEDKFGEGIIPGIKDDKGNWDIQGHRDRIINVGKEELKIFALLFDGSHDYTSARLPALHSKQFVEVFKLISGYPKKISDYDSNIFSSQLWQETGAQKDGTIKRNTTFVDNMYNLIISGPHIGVANPLYKTPRKICNKKGDYDSINLFSLASDYIQRTNYTISRSMTSYKKGIPVSSWGISYIDSYRVVMRRMLNLSGERTLFPAIIPPKIGHIHTICGFQFQDIAKLTIFAGSMSSIIYDALIKNTGRNDVYYDTIKNFPMLNNNDYTIALSVRTLMLNSLTIQYSSLWSQMWEKDYIEEMWSKSDPRLRPEKFTNLTSEWTWDTPLRTDYERRQALVEIDVLTAMALGMTLEQLKTIYRIQFPVLQQYEADTWYDQNGRIVFTNNRSLTGVGFSRNEFEPKKNAKAGEKFYRTITDETMPGGPVERTIEYVAPFDKCDREQDYEIAWKFFEERYKK